MKAVLKSEIGRANKIVMNNEQCKNESTKVNKDL